MLSWFSCGTEDRSGTSGSLGSWSKEDIQEHGEVIL